MKYERYERTIGRYIVSMRGQEADVWMVDSVQQVARNLTAREALMFLGWLDAHKEELYRAVAQDEQERPE